MMGFIYLITNKINNKKYVGKTTTTIEKRWLEHIADSKKEKCEIRPLYRALRKYGIDNFFIKEIEKCDIKNLSKREQYWIQYYNTYENGYNATLGGDGKILLDYNEIVRVYLTTHNAKEVSRILKCSADSVCKALKLNNIPILEHGEVTKRIASKRIAQYDKEGNFIKEYSSYREAEKAMGNTQRHIGDCANGKRKSAYGFIWKWID